MDRKKAKIAAIISAGLLFAGILLILEHSFLLFKKKVTWPILFKQFSIQAFSPDATKESLGPALLPVPDLSVYTMENLEAKIPALSQGRVLTASMKSVAGFDKFTEIRRQKEFSRLQGHSDPTAIVVASGVYDLGMVEAEIGDERLLSRKEDVFLLRVPLYIAPGAALVIRGDAGKRVVLRMSSVTGGFLVNAGHLFIVDAEVAGWDDKKNEFPFFEKSEKFRPFITAWSGSEIYFGRSGFYDLGYAASKSYGISLSSSTPIIKDNPEALPPKGWIVGSRFERVYYGFYSYEAEDVAIVDNIYHDNIVYAIDPHDRSKRLIIAGNETSGTRKKHGIIISREVNDSWIVGNVSHHNRGSGFMLDRSSVRNLVADNLAYANGSDGLTLFESQDNVVERNRFLYNGKNGLRLRNSWNIAARDNLMAFNKGLGVQVYAQDIRKMEEEDRDFEEDPFTMRASMDMRDSTVFMNRTGAFKFNDSDLIRLSGIHFYWYTKKFVRGDLDNLTDDIAVGLRRAPGGVEIRKIGAEPAREVRTPAPVEPNP